MRVKFWGTRGSIPVPGKDTIKYGGNTPCVEVRTDDNTLIIIDAGTGIRNLGTSLLATEFGRGEGEGYIFISHTHWDHIQGLPFFAPIFVPGNKFTIYGASSKKDKQFKTVIDNLMDHDYFPIKWDNLKEVKTDKSLVVNVYDIFELTQKSIKEKISFKIKNNIIIKALRLNHPGIDLGYRIENGSSILSYICDNEPYKDVFIGKGGIRKDEAGLFSDDEDKISESIKRLDQYLLYDMVKDADLLIIDTHFTEEEYKSKIGWGHGTPDYAIDIAKASNVKQMALFHHDPYKTDKQIDEMLEYCQQKLSIEKLSLKVIAASEGTEIQL